MSVSNILTTSSGGSNATKESIGLGNADNTSDLNKPISTAVQNALNLKVNIGDAFNSASTITFYMGNNTLSTPIANTLNSIAPYPLYINEFEVLATVSNSSSVIMNTYISEPIAIAVIKAGYYNYHHWIKHDTSGALATITYRWSLYHEDSTSTVIFTHTTNAILSTTYIDYPLSINQPSPIPCLPTDRLYLEIVTATTSVTPINISYIQGGLARNCTIVTPIDGGINSITQSALNLKSNITNPTFQGTITTGVGSNLAPPLKFMTGALLTTPVAGALEFDGTNLYITM
jgi:hypothetical protein